MNDIEKNINNCYITSSLQTFLHLEDFITDVRSINIKNKKENMKLTSEFRKLIDDYFDRTSYDFEYAKTQYMSDMELSKIYEEAIKN